MELSSVGLRVLCVGESQGGCGVGIDCDGHPLNVGSGTGYKWKFRWARSMRDSVELMTVFVRSSAPALVQLNSVREAWSMLVGRG